MRWRGSSAKPRRSRRCRIRTSWRSTTSGRRGVVYAVTELLEGETLARQARRFHDLPEAGRGLGAADRARASRRRTEGCRPSGPEARQRLRVEGRARQDSRLRAGEAVRQRLPDEQTKAPTGSGHTEPGTVMGTMGYMSPEQVRGLPGRSPHGHLLLRGDPLRALVGQEGVQAGHGERHDRGDPQGGAAGADAVRSERLARAGPHRSALSGEGPGEPFPVGARTWRSRCRRHPSRPRRSRAACMSFRRGQPRAGRWPDCSRGGRRCSPPRVSSSGSAPKSDAPVRCRRQARRGAALREPRRARGRLLRRRHRGRGARQADLRAGPRGHRAGQLDALQEDDQDAAGDREGARRRTTS